MTERQRLEGPALDTCLPASVWRRVSASATRRRFADGALIHMRGDVRPGLSIVRSGNVRFGNPGRDGSYVIAAVMGPGAIFGEATLFAGLPRTHEAVAIGRTEIDEISRERVFRLLEDEPSLARGLLLIVTTRLYNTLQSLDDVQRLPLSVRLAKLLLARESNGEVVASQAELADQAGVSRVSIGKALATLRKAGLATPLYGRIEIDLDGLRAYIADRHAIAPLRPLD